VLSRLDCLNDAVPRHQITGPLEVLLLMFSTSIAGQGLVLVVSAICAGDTVLEGWKKRERSKKVGLIRSQCAVWVGEKVLVADASLDLPRTAWPCRGQAILNEKLRLKDHRWIKDGACIHQAWDAKWKSWVNKRRLMLGDKIGEIGQGSVEGAPARRRSRWNYFRE
jgi:hypothetical protein